MNLEHLKALLEEFPESRIAALVDMSSGIVLGVRAKEKQPQERLDALCDTATELLVGETGTAFTKAMGLPGVTGQQQAVVASDSQTTLFLQLPDASEALIIVCSVGIDVARLLEAANCKFDAAAAPE